MKKYITKILLVIFALIFVVSCTMIIRELVIRRQAAVYINEIKAEYAPFLHTGGASGSGDSEEENTTDTSNPEVQTMVADYPDVIGWLTVDGAEISHPFVIGEDNGEYLRADLDGNYLITGTLFMDYRNSRDLNDGLSVIYGHNMKDKSMFGKLTNYQDLNFLKENPDVYVSLPDETLHYTAFACMIADSTDSPVYENFGRRDDIQDIVDYIVQNADYLNGDVEVDGDSKLLLLSTCNPVYFTARLVLVCVLDQG